MPETRNDELYRALKHNGYPDDFCREIAYRQMNTDFTATRMLGYLYRVTSPGGDQQNVPGWPGKYQRRYQQYRFPLCTPTARTQRWLPW